MRRFLRRLYNWFMEPPSRLSLFGTAAFVILFSTLVSDAFVQQNNLELYGTVGGLPYKVLGLMRWVGMSTEVFSGCFPSTLEILDGRFYSLRKI